jgi:hypothetical protein
LVGCGATDIYKPLAENQIKRGKVAVTYEFDYSTKARGFLPFVGIYVSGKMTDLVKAHKKNILTNMVSEMKNNLSILEPRIKIDENSFFESAGFAVGSSAREQYKKLITEGYKYVLIVEYTPRYNARSMGSTSDFIALNFCARLQNMDTGKIIAVFNISPNVELRDKNEKNWKREECVDEQSNKKYFIKVTNAGTKFLVSKLFNFLKTGIKPVMKDMYNGEKFLKENNIEI